MSKRECLIVSVLFLVSLALLSLSFQKRWIEGYADTAFLSELYQNVAAGNGPVTHVAASTYEASKLWGEPVEKACRTPEHAPAEPLNYFRKVHPYFILYLAAPLLLVTDVDWAFGILMAFSFTGLLFSSYLFLRSRNVNALAATLFGFVVSVHPAWRESMWGQSYVDRLFLIVGFIVAWCLYKKKWYLALLSGTLAVLINDRVGLVCATICASYFVFSKIKADRKILASFCVGFVLFSAYMLFVYVSGYPSTATFASMPLAYFFESPRAILQVATLLFINVVIFGGWAVAAWPEFLTALVALLPNVIGNVGGAEKTGWLTHYHSLYFPLLVFAAALGLSKFWSRIDQNDSKSKFKVYGFLTIQFFLLSVTPLDFSQSFKPDFSFSSWMPVKLASTLQQSAHRTKLEGIAKLVPEGAKVGTVEALMPALLKNRQVDYFPNGIADDEYLVLPFERIGDRVLPRGSILYSSAEDRLALDECLLNRIHELGFDFSGAVFFEDLIILQRKR